MRRIVLALVLAFLSLPVFAAPCAGFTDVDTSSSFCSSVAWMKNRGITLGCTATQYCPNDPVTRLQMAAFMYRLGFQNAFLKDGNAFGATAVLGTTDNQPLDVRVNNSRVMRYEPNPVSPHVIGGHAANNVSGAGSAATIGGGGEVSFPNRVTGSGGTVAGGHDNSAAFSSSVGGGYSNAASGSYSTVGGGYDNRASGTDSTVAAGSINTASGARSFAAGHRANANGSDCAVFSLWGSSPGMQCFGVQSQFFIGALHGLSVDYFSQRADGGGHRFLYIGDRFPPYTIVAWNNATLTDAGVWTNASDAAKKQAFAPIDPLVVLDKVAAMPIHSWRYIVEPDGIRHIGPTAQDFMAAFGLGHDDKTIGTIDADGVALAAIQGLNAKLETALAERDERIEALTNELAQLREAQAREIAELRQAVAALLARQPAAEDADRIAARSP